MCQFDSIVSLSVELDNQASDFFRNVVSVFWRRFEHKIVPYP